MDKVDWPGMVLESEILYSEALGGKNEYFEKFIHIYNSYVPWAGDFNRALGIKLNNYKDFEEIEEKVRDIHRRYNLHVPDYYDVLPPLLRDEVWCDYLSQKGYYFYNILYFQAPSISKILPRSFSFYKPSEDEYMEWYEKEQKRKSYYTSEWFELIKPCQINFIKTFTPYWLIEDSTVTARLYAGGRDDFFRLFDVEVEEKYRGQGRGRILLHAVRIEAGKEGRKYVLLQTAERLRPFYERCSFRECFAGSAIRLR